MTLEEQALSLAERGWFVFPIRVSPPGADGKRKKKPMIGSWGDEASDDPDAIAKMHWHAATHVAVHCEKSKVWVIDVDDPESLKLYQPPYTCQQDTLREGGRHYLYQAKEFDQRNGTKTPVTGQDIRANGGCFVWYNLGELNNEPLEPWPFDAPMSEPKRERGDSHSHSSEWDDLEVNEGSRNDSLAKYLGLLRSKGLEFPELLACAVKWNDDYCKPPLDRAEVLDVVNSIMEYPPEDNRQKKDEEKTNSAAGEYQAVSLAGFMGAQRELANFVVSEWFPRRVVTLLGGHGGTGKSSFALLMAACVACGRNIADREVQSGKVVFLSLEDEASVVLYRLQCIVNQLGLDVQMIERNLRVLDGTGCGLTALFTEGERGSQPYLTKHYGELLEASVGADAVFVDNSSDAFMADENNRRQVRLFMAALARMARQNNAAVVLLAHIDKAAARYGAEGNSYSGSTAWHNSSRSRLALLDASDCLKLIHEKHNYSKKAADVLLEFRGGAVMPAPDGYVPSDPSLAMFDSEEVFDVMQAMLMRGEQIPAAIGGPSNMYMAMHPWFSDGGIADNPKTYKKRLLKAVLALEGQKRIKKEAKLLSKNNKRDFWVLG